MKIDAHVHLYDPARPGGVPWPPADSPLFRTVLPEHVHEASAGTGVTHAVVVECSPLLEDNQWILDLVDADERLVGCVGNLDLTDLEFPGHLERFSAHPLYCGIRARGFDEKTLLASPSSEHLELLSAAGKSLDLLARPGDLHAVAELASRHPGLRIVLDHVVHVQINGNTPAAEWLEGLRIVAEHPNVFCKVSGLPENTGANPAPTDPSFYRPTIEALIEALGPRRLLWASNWPVCSLFAEYATAFDVAAAVIDELPVEDREEVYGNSARRAYRLA